MTFVACFVAYGQERIQLHVRSKDLYHMFISMIEPTEIRDMTLNLIASCRSKNT